MNDGVSPLTQGARDLAATARSLVPVMEAAAKGQQSIAELTRAAGVQECDARKALYILEDLGLVESTHYRPTEAGRKALKP